MVWNLSGEIKTKNNLLSQKLNIFCSFSSAEWSLVILATLLTQNSFNSCSWSTMSDLIGQTTKLIVGCNKHARWKQSDFQLPVGRSPIVSLLERIFWIIGNCQGLKSSYPIKFFRKNCKDSLFLSKIIYEIGVVVDNLK